MAITHGNALYMVLVAERTVPVFYLLILNEHTNTSYIVPVGSS